MGFSRFSVKFPVVVILHEAIDSSYSSFAEGADGIVLDRGSGEQRQR